MTENNISPFEIKDCSILSIATGRHAINVKELLTQLLSVDPDSIYYHFWGKLLRTSFSTPEFNNDFAQWVSDQIHDKSLAEKLSVLEPQDYQSVDELRQEMIDIIQISLEQNTVLLYTNAQEPFHFLKLGMVVFNTSKVINEPLEFVDIIDNLSYGSLYFHFIDARRRTQNHRDDFSNWIALFGNYDDLVDMIINIDPFFLPLSKLKEKISNIFKTYFK
ncbi:MAG TPA: hypothetical protein ENM99_00205 [Desulfurella acetivorans]|uniref:Uncharacterized protein n=1 Tax=Desulfurella acetivorans TaxID=33002 RepID=A0A7C6E7E0_DESAE|nr:hypothetical protein [Desulfurella acetivorans]